MVLIEDERRDDDGAHAGGRCGEALALPLKHGPVVRDVHTEGSVGTRGQGDIRPWSTCRVSNKWDGYPSI